MYKKTIAFILIISLALFISGCAKPAEDTSAEDVGADETADDAAPQQDAESEVGSGISDAGSLDDELDASDLDDSGLADLDW